MRSAVRIASRIVVAALVAGAVVSAPTASQAIGNCPVPLGSLTGDTSMTMDLCSMANDVSPFGQFVERLPETNIEYPSCDAASQARSSWASSGYPGDSLPGGGGLTQPNFKVRAETFPAGENRLRVVLKLEPSDTNYMRINSFSYPGMTTEEKYRAEQMIQALRVHENGHENIAGWLAARYDNTEVMIGTGTVEEVLAQAKPLVDAYTANMQDQFVAIQDAYDSYVQHGVRQDKIGGKAIFFSCTVTNPMSISIEMKVKASGWNLPAGSTSSKQCETGGSANAQATFKPFPQRFLTQTYAYGPCTISDNIVPYTNNEPTLLAGQGVTLSRDMSLKTATSKYEMNQNVAASALVDRPANTAAGTQQATMSVRCASSSTATGSTAGSGRAEAYSHVRYTIEARKPSVLSLQFQSSGNTNGYDGWNFIYYPATLVVRSGSVILLQTGATSGSYEIPLPAMAETFRNYDVTLGQNCLKLVPGGPDMSRFGSVRLTVREVAS